jgi:hypothetical protein
MQTVDKLNFEKSQLKARSVDTEKLQARVKILSKQLKIPLGHSATVEEQINDFLGQAWIRIKSQDGVDELAD